MSTVSSVTTPLSSEFGVDGCCFPAPVSVSTPDQRLLRSVAATRTAITSMATARTMTRLPLFVVVLLGGTVAGMSKNSQCGPLNPSGQIQPGCLKANVCKLQLYEVSSESLESDLRFIDFDFVLAFPVIDTECKISTAKS